MTTTKILGPDTQKLNGAYGDPDTFLIVGLDTFPKGIDPDQYEQYEDPRRVRMPLKEFLVESIMAHGVNDPITCVSARASSGDRYRIVVNGRQRVRAAREANKRFAEKGSKERVAVPYVTKNDADRFTVAASNEGHTAQSPLDKAEKAQRMLKFGATRAQVRATFEENGVIISAATLDNYLSLLKLSERDKARLEAGTLGLTEAYALARNGKVSKPGKAESDEEPESGPVRKPRAPSKKALAALAEIYAPSDTEEYESEIEEFAGALLDWVCTGDVRSLDKWPDVAKHAEAVTRPSYKIAKEEM